MRILYHTDKPVAFTEISWRGKASPLDRESSDEEQAEFIDTFFGLTGDMNVVIAIWSFVKRGREIEHATT